MKVGVGGVGGCRNSRQDRSSTDMSGKCLFYCELAAELGGLCLVHNVSILGRITFV